MAQYWLVGATWGDEEKADEFVENGIWMLGWQDGFQRDKAEKMQKGDRIAIKRRTGSAADPLIIQHIGIIQGIVLGTNSAVCTVNWVANHVNREIAESRGCIQSVHGPYGHDEWVEKIFCL